MGGGKGELARGAGQARVAGEQRPLAPDFELDRVVDPNGSRPCRCGDKPGLASAPIEGGPGEADAGPSQPPLTEAPQRSGRLPGPGRVSAGSAQDQQPLVEPTDSAGEERSAPPRRAPSRTQIECRP